MLDGSQLVIGKEMSRPKLPTRLKQLPRLRLDVLGILARAEYRKDVLTMESDIGTVGYAYDKGRVLLIQGDGFVINTVEDWRAIIEELKWVIEEADKWTRS